VESKKQNKWINKQNAEIDAEMRRTNWWLSEGREVGGWTKCVKGSRTDQLPVME